jgi:hypothetical protein
MATRQSRSDQLIADYLRELKVSTWVRGVPSSQAQALQNEVRSKIDAALAAAGDRDEATVYQVLDRLGPPVAFVEHLAATPRSTAQQVSDTVLAPITRVRAMLAVRGWGLAEIGALLLLFAGPFVLWWLGPIFGIILVRVAAGRWSAQVTKRATAFVVVLLAVQAVVATAIFVMVYVQGGSAAAQMQDLLLLFDPNLNSGRGLVPGALGLLSPVELLMISPAYVAGIGSAIYLALSKRYRTAPTGSVAVEPN